MKKKSQSETHLSSECLCTAASASEKENFNHETCAKPDPTQERGKMDHKYTK